MHNIEISIYKRPFVLLSVLLGAGILFSFFYGELSNLLLISVLIISFILLIWINVYRRPIFGLVCISICCFCLGIVLASNRLNRENLKSFDESYPAIIFPCDVFTQIKNHVVYQWLTNWKNVV